MAIARKKESVESHDTLCTEEEKENSKFKCVEKGTANRSPICLNKYINSLIKRKMWRVMILYRLKKRKTILNSKEGTMQWEPLYYLLQ